MNRHAFLRMFTRSAVCFGLAVTCLALAASTAFAQQEPPHSVTSLGGPTRFIAPVNDITALAQSMGRPAIQADLAILGVLEQMDNYHPHDEPIWYLPAIGVEPAGQRKGLGSALLKHTLQLCDEMGTRTYLESSNPANIPLYERHGFEVIGRIEVGAAPPVHPMIREKR